MRKWLLVPLILIVVFAIGLVVVRAALSPERVRALVQPRLEAALARPVELGAIRISTLPLAVHVERVAIAAPAGFASERLLHIGTLDLEPRLLPLLARRIAIRSVRVRELEIWVEQRADSMWNWAAPARAAAPAPPRANAEPALGLAIDALEIEAGRVHFAAAPAGLRAEIPLAAAIGLRADRLLHDVRVSGWVAADSIRATVATLGDMRLPRLRLEPDLRIDVPESTATVERLRVHINRAALDLAGTARMHGHRPELHLATRTDGVPLAELLAALPPDAAATRGVQATGTVQFDLRADVVPGATPALRGSVRLVEGSVQAATLPEKVAHLNVSLVCAGDSLRIDEVRAQIGDAPVRIAGLVVEAWSPARTRYDVHVTAAFDLARLARVAPLPPGVSLAGRADIDMRARGHAARPDSVVVSGPLALRDVVVRTPQLRQPLGADARLQGDGTRLRIETARLTAGESVLDLQGTITPVMPPGRPRLDLQSSTPRLDLVALLPATAAAGATAPADTATTRRGSASTLVPVLPPVDARIRLTAREVLLQGGSIHDVTVDMTSNGATADMEFRAGRLAAGETTLYDATGTVHAADRAGTGRVRAARATLHKLEATQLESDVEIQGQTIRLPTMRARAYAGTLRGTTFLDLADPGRPRYAIETAAQQIQFGAFLGSLTPLGSVVTGALDLDSKWSFAGPGPQFVRQSLSGTGLAASTNGRIADLPFLSQLASLLQLPSLKTIPYRDLGLSFAVESGRLAMRDCIVHGNDADFGVGGSVGLDGSLDLGIQVTLSQEASRRALGERGSGALSSLFTDASGRLVFDVRVGGTHRAPKLQLDASKTASRAGLAALTDNALRRLLGGRLPAPARPAGSDTTTATPAPTASEDLRQRALEEARKKLGGSLGGLLGGTRPAPVDSTRRPR